ncbi:protein ABHD8-like [Dendronephthya gigantea]|uniref:protein ABHD8-like n=1 Tax=Dendronephthya gigantea TaxID=151771 RepID=UPI00106A912C|nr:protein ABHD8-like [Dendronephthya gigantea]
MCCSETNRIDVETADDTVEVRKGRWLRIIHRNPDGIPGESHVTGNAVHSSVFQVNSWLVNGVENQPFTIMNDNHGPGERTNKIVIFFIHGVGGSSEIWNEQIEHFTKLGYVVVASDILGHGGSSAPRDASSYTFSEIALDMFAVFDRYRSDRRNILVGHSYGCSFCTKIASERPRQVSKMILISGGGPVPLIPQPCQLFCLPSLILACLKPFVVWSFRRMGFHAHTSRNTIQSSGAFEVPSYVLRATMMGQTWNEGNEEFHSDLMVATLLIYGNHDNFVTLDEETHMHETIYGSTLEVLENAGHMVMLECPDKVNELILQFLRRDDSTQSDILLANGSRPGCSTVSEAKNTASTIHDSQLSLHTPSDI